VVMPGPKSNGWDPARAVSATGATPATYATGRTATQRRLGSGLRRAVTGRAAPRTALLPDARKGRRARPRQRRSGRQRPCRSAVVHALQVASADPSRHRTTAGKGRSGPAPTVSTAALAGYPRNAALSRGLDPPRRRRVRARRPGAAGRRVRDVVAGPGWRRIESGLPWLTRR
jgi:hypothetical protein